jgi:hypothetical protein
MAGDSLREIGDDDAQWPQRHLRTASLKHHCVDDACITYVHPQVANGLMCRKSRLVRHLYVGDILCDVIGLLLRQPDACEAR